MDPLLLHSIASYLVNISILFYHSLQYLLSFCHFIFIVFNSSCSRKYVFENYFELLCVYMCMWTYWTGPAVYNESYIESKKLVVVGKTLLTPNILYSVSWYLVLLFSIVARPYGFSGFVKEQSSCRSSHLLLITVSKYVRGIIIIIQTLLKYIN